VSWPAAEVIVEVDMVRALVASQFPELADLECVAAGEGFDNYQWRLGDDLVARIPRRSMAIEPLLNELRWLDDVVARVTLQTPAPLRAGVPGEGFPFPWAVATWIEGETGDQFDLRSAGSLAPDLAQFLRQIHVAAPTDAPHNPYRSVNLSERSAEFDARLDAIAEHLDAHNARELFARGRDSAPCVNPVWIHGDLHPDNLVFRDGKLVGVVDFGDLCAGDPATDLAGVLLTLPGPALEAFFDAYEPIDDPTQRRMIGWATYFGVMMISLGIGGRASYLAVGERGLANAALWSAHS
jgi:aminoglycoside phosphotransferase (APT) family kinase protein